MRFDNTKVEIIPIEEMGGLRFGVFYFDDNEKLYVSPSILEGLEDGTIEDLQYVQLSWESVGRNIHEDAATLVEEFKKMPKGSEISFDLQEKLKEFDEERTGQQRIIHSPKWSPN